MWQRESEENERNGNSGGNLLPIPRDCQGLAPSFWPAARHFMSSPAPAPSLCDLLGQMFGRHADDDDDDNDGGGGGAYSDWPTEDDEEQQQQRRRGQPG